MSIQIREETSQDREAVYSIHERAFQQDNEARLVNALRGSTAFVPGLSLVAMLNQQVAGHILFTRILINQDASAHESLALAPVAVAPEHQRQGIGSALIKAGLQKAAELGYGSVIVLGHAGYYPKFGFRPAASWKIKAPFDVPENLFMALELRPGALQDISGTVVYAKEFEMGS